MANFHVRWCGALAAALSLSIGVFAQDPQSGDPKQRIKAVREYAKQGASGVESLRRMLHDADSAVRVEAVKGLVEVGGSGVLEPLMEATRDNDPQVQMRATDGLVNFYLPGYVQQGRFEKIGSALKSPFSDKNDAIIPSYVTVREDVLQAIGKLVSGGGSTDVRANAARALGILRGKAALPVLVEALRSKDTDVLAEALLAIQKIRDPSVGPKLAPLFNDLSERVQTTAIETAGLLRSKETLPDLRRVYAKSGKARVQRTVLTAIGNMPDEQDRPLFEKALEDQKDENLRAAGAEGLGRLGNRADIGKLQPLFNSERKMKPRLAIAFAVVKLGATETSEFSPLQYLSNTLNSKLYTGVAEGYLVELARDPQVRENLYPLIPKGTRAEKMGLARVLSVSGDKSGVAPLEALTRDSDGEVAESGLRALKVLKARLP